MLCKVPERALTPELGLLKALCSQQQTSCIKTCKHFSLCMCEFGRMLKRKSLPTVNTNVCVLANITMCCVKECMFFNLENEDIRVFDAEDSGDGTV